MSPKKRPTKTTKPSVGKTPQAKSQAKSAVVKKKSSPNKVAIQKGGGTKSSGLKTPNPGSLTKVKTGAKKATGKSAKITASKKLPSKNSAKGSSEKVNASKKATNIVSNKPGGLKKPVPAKTKSKSSGSSGSVSSAKLSPSQKSSSVSSKGSIRPGVQATSTKSNAKTLAASKPMKPAASATSSKPLKKTNDIHSADFDKFRQLLLTLRHRLIGDVNMMSREALGGSDGAADNHAPIHPAEVGTHSFEQEFTLNLLSSDGDRLDRIEAALEKIADGTYGCCEECGARIPRARLEVIPDTPFCVKCATRLEV